MNIETRYEEMPLSIKGACIKLTEAEENYIILINSLVSEEEQQEALKHERLHIELDHFNRGVSVDVAESEVRELMRS